MKQHVVCSISKDIFQIISDEIFISSEKIEKRSEKIGKGSRKSGKVRENRERFENSRKICWANDFSSRSIHSFLPSLIQNSDQNLPSVLTLKPAYLVNNSFSVIMSASTSSRSLQEKRIVMRRHGISSLEERGVIVHSRVYMLL